MELDKDREIQAQNLALIGELAGGVAHDFNNLLTAMQFHLANLKVRMPAIPELRPSIDALEKLMASASTSTRQLLTFARLRTVDVHPLEINSTLGQSLELLGRLLGESMEVIYLPTSEPYWVSADAAMIDQAVLNLCFNARDAMPRGGVLTVETGLLNHSKGEYVTLRFSDTGVGIAPEDLSKVFEPFFTTKETGKGTGLGLASVYEGARRHHGWAEVESVLGEGTVFTLYLPRIAAPISAGDTAFLAAPKTGASILLVDDDPLVREAVAEMLKGAGYEVHEAVNAAEGWNLLNVTPGIDLIVTDWVMPGTLNGMEWVTKLKRERPELPAILLSGSPRGARTPEGIVLVNKPVHLATLINAIEKSLQVSLETKH